MNDGIDYNSGISLIICGAVAPLILLFDLSATVQNINKLGIDHVKRLAFGLFLFFINHIDTK